MHDSDDDGGDEVSNSKQKPAGNVSLQPPTKMQKQQPAPKVSPPKPEVKAAVTAKPAAAPAKDVPFEKILKGVTFVLSGFENPYRNTVCNFRLFLETES